MSLVYIVCVLILLDDESFKWIDSNGTRDKFFFWDLLRQLKTLSFIWMATTRTLNNMDKHFFFLPFFPIFVSSVHVSSHSETPHMCTCTSMSASPTVLKLLLLPLWGMPWCAVHDIFTRLACYSMLLLQNPACVFSSQCNYCEGSSIEVLSSNLSGERWICRVGWRGEPQIQIIVGNFLYCIAVPCQTSGLLASFPTVPKLTRCRKLAGNLHASSAECWRGCLEGRSVLTRLQLGRSLLFILSRDSVTCFLWWTFHFILRFVHPWPAQTIAVECKGTTSIENLDLCLSRNAWLRSCFNSSESCRPPLRSGLWKEAKFSQRSSARESDFRMKNSCQCVATVRM